jgi:hypothetical protein
MIWLQLHLAEDKKFELGWLGLVQIQAWLVLA